MQISPFIYRMATKCVAFLFILIHLQSQAQILDTEFGNEGTLIINHSVYDLARGSAFRDGRLLIGNSEYDWYLPRIDAFQNDGDQDFSFGSGGDATWGWFDFPSIENGSILYDSDAIYVGYTTRPDNFITSIRKFDIDGQPVESFGTDGILSETITTFDVVWWYDSFAGIQKWGDDIVMAGATPDTTFIWKIHADGTPDLEFGENGIARFDWGDFFGQPNAYEIHSWFCLGDKLYFNVEYSDWLTSQSYIKILPINSDGTLDIDGVIDVTAYQHDFILKNGETIYLKKGSQLKRCSGTTFALDPTFGDEGTLYNNSGWGCNYAFGPDGSIYQYGSIGTSPQMAYCGRFNANGQLDTSFGEDGILTAPALVEDDQVYVSNVVATENELYLIGGSGVFGVSSGGYSDLFVRRYTGLGTNVSETKKSELIVYPNPANETVTLQSNFTGSWTISDIQGRTVQSGLKSNTITSIDLTTLQSGVYILNLGQSHHQFIKQ